MSVTHVDLQVMPTSKTLATVVHSTLVQTMCAYERPVFGELGTVNASHVFKQVVPAYKRSRASVRRTAVRAVHAREGHADVRRGVRMHRGRPWNTC